MYLTAPRQGSHVGAMVFAGVIGLGLIGMSALRGDTPAPRAQPTPLATQTTAPLPKLADLDSAWVSQTPPAQIAVGGEAAITVRFRNTGRAAWARGTGSEASLAFVGTDANFDPKMAVNWPLPGKPAVQSEDVVAPGGVATFTFTVKGVAVGTYRIDVRPTVIAVGPLRDEGVYAEVTVR
jgi:hypothetical protein